MYQIFKISSTFVLSLLEQKVPAEGPRLIDYAEATPKMSNLIVASNNTASIVLIRQTGQKVHDACRSFFKERRW